MPVKPVEGALGAYKRLCDLHSQHEDQILKGINPYDSQYFYVEGKKYIRRPDFDVHTLLYNPTNPEEIGNPISVESSLFITQLLEYCTFVDPRRVDGKTMAQIAYRLVRNIKTEDPIKHFYDYLDKGLIQLAIRICKVIVGP